MANPKTLRARIDQFATSLNADIHTNRAGHREVRHERENLFNSKAADDKIGHYGNSKSFETWAGSNLVAQGGDCAPVLNNDPVERRREAQIRDKDGVACHHLSQVEVLEQKAHNDEDLEIGKRGQDISPGGRTGISFWIKWKWKCIVFGNESTIPSVATSLVSKHLAVGEVCREVYKHCSRAPRIQESLLLQQRKGFQHIRVKAPELRDKTVLDVAIFIRRPRVRHL